MDKYFDPRENRLVYLERKADPAFWDERWAAYRSEAIFNVRRVGFLVRTTAAYLPTGSRIIEGGCGEGEKLFALDRSGYDAFGIDFASETLRWLHGNRPKLAVIEGDLERLPFPDATFDGYWSLGVIEHGFTGFGGLMNEMHRVLCPGGILFVTAPAMNPVRWMKARLGLYPSIGAPERCRDRFYQFAVNPRKTLDIFRQAGFRLLERRRIDPVTGLQDECPAVKSFMARADATRWLPARVLMKSIRMTLAPLVGHQALFVLRKEPESAGRFHVQRFKEAGGAHVRSSRHLEHIARR